MKIRMLETRKGTEDGFSVRQYEQGNVYEVNVRLAEYFFAHNYAASEEQTIKEHV